MKFPAKVKKSYAVQCTKWSKNSSAVWSFCTLHRIFGLSRYQSYKKLWKTTFYELLLIKSNWVKKQKFVVFCPKTAYYNLRWLSITNLCNVSLYKFSIKALRTSISQLYKKSLLSKVIYCMPKRNKSTR